MNNLEEKINLMQIKITSLENALQSIYKSISTLSNNNEVLLKVASLINEEMR